MRQRAGWIAAIAMVIPLTTATSIVCAADGGNVDQAPPAISSPDAEAVRNLTLAQQLAQYARVKKDALLMIAAAKLTKDASARDSKRDKGTETSLDDQGGAPPATTAGTSPKTGLPKTDQAAVTKLLDEARALASDRKDLVAMIDEVGRVTRGAVGGPKRSYDVVAPRAADVYHVKFRAGELATVGVITDGNPSLYLRVFDENGNMICSDNYDGSAGLLCRWVPRWQGVFIIKIGNRSYDTGEYVVVTN